MGSITRSSEPPRPLSIWQRLFFGVILPHVILYPSIYGLWLRERLAPRQSGPDSLGLLDLVEFAMKAIAAIYLFVIPVLICTILLSIRPWKHWYSAIFGGAAGIVLGSAVGLIVATIIEIATR